MAMQDDSGVSQSNEDAIAPTQTVPESASQPREETPPLENTSAVQHVPPTWVKKTRAILPQLRRQWPMNQATLVTSLRKIKLTSKTKDEAVPAITSTNAAAATMPALVTSGKRRRKAKKDRLQGWDTWSAFRLWRHTRPFWGSVLMLLGSLLLLSLPISLLRFAFLLDSLWASVLLGALLLVMALVQLFVPSYAVLTGAIGIVLSLVSFITSSFGGLIIGMLLGIIGGALSVSWRPVKRSRLMATSSRATT